MEPHSRPGLLKNIKPHFSIIALMAIMLFSCENDMAVVNELTRRDSLPELISYDIELHYSEHGRLQFLLTSPQAAFKVGDEAYQEFPDGFHVVFFDSLMNKTSELSADYGINFEKRNLMEARRNVVVINHEKHEKMNTEHMIWDRGKKKISSDVFVKITTPTDVIYGENGFEADENFNSWVIRKTSGEFEFEEE